MVAVIAGIVFCAILTENILNEDTGIATGGTVGFIINCAVMFLFVMLCYWIARGLREPGGKASAIASFVLGLLSILLVILCYQILHGKGEFAGLCILILIPVISMAGMIFAFHAGRSGLKWIGWFMSLFGLNMCIKCTFSFAMAGLIGT